MVDGSPQMSVIHTVDALSVIPLAIAFILGAGARFAGLPPLIGFLLAGFVLSSFGVTSSPMLQQVADLGITLLLFTIGLKLKVKDLLSPVVWGTASTHMFLVTLASAVTVMVAAYVGFGLDSTDDLRGALLIGFALSFSSTVFAVKVLESRGEMNSTHGRISIGILIMQDLFAVLFIVVSAGKIPSPWAILLLGLLPLRPLLLMILNRAGHGELLILLGWMMPLAGAALFTSVGMKADLGALILGVLLSGHVKSSELAKSLLSFKDLFLVGFFLTIGLSGELSWYTLSMSLFLVIVLLPIKAGLFFWIMTRLKMRARSATLASLDLANFSEFGLIVGILGVSNGWLDERWMSVFAISLSISFIVASPINKLSTQFYERWRGNLRHFQKLHRLPGDELINPGHAEVLVFGMGRVGTGAYDHLHERWGNVVLGIDLDPIKVASHQKEGRNVILGDATDLDFWARIEGRGEVWMALLVVPDIEANLTLAKLMRQHGYDIRLSAAAMFPDDVDRLLAAGVDDVFNFYQGAGSGFADHVIEKVGDPDLARKAHDELSATRCVHPKI